MKTIPTLKSWPICWLITVFCALGQTEIQAQGSPPTGWYLHYNQERCGPLQTFRQQVQYAAAEDALSKSRKRWLPLLVERVFPLAQHPYLANAYRLSAGLSPAELLWALDTCVDFFEPEPLDIACSMPNDPALSELGDFYQYEIPFLRLPEAWEKINNTSVMSIGVVDTWVDTTHEDLAGQFFHVAVDPSGVNHGTAVAGLAGAATSNALGIASAGYGTRLYAIWDGNVDYSALQLARAGAKIIVIPWINRCHHSPIQRALYDEIRDLGTLAIASAGNGISTWYCDDPHDPVYPASLASVLSISSVGHRYERGYVDSIVGEAWNWKDVHNLFPLREIPVVHSHNDSVDLVAPGHGLLSTLPGNAYADAWGTSFSAPMVAGVAALVWSVNPCMKPGEVSEILKASAYRVDTLPENLPYLGKLGHGRVDARAAVDMALGQEHWVLSSGADEEWSDYRRVGTRLVLEAGARLRVRGRVYFGEGAELVMQRGSRLVLDGGELIGSCEKGWKGIRVLGNPILDPPSLAMLNSGTYPNLPHHHAVLELRNDALISGADTAILSIQGGIARVLKGRFIDNTISYGVVDYPFEQRSFVHNAQFSWQDRLPDLPASQVYLRNVRNVKFEGCIWSCSEVRAGLRAIEARDAGFTLSAGVCEGTACWPPPNGMIEGFDLGVEVWSSSGFTPSPVLLEHTSFKSCRRAILLRGLDAAQLRDLDVQVPMSLGLEFPDASYGIHLEGCRNSRLERVRVAGQGGYSLGLLSYASEGYPTEIRSSTFENLYAGVSVIGNNGDDRAGLQLRCNRFGGNQTDVWMVPGSVPPSIASYQGDCTGTPAANRFSHTALSSTPAWIMDPSSATVWYAHHNAPVFIPSTTDYTLLRLVDCIRTYAAGDCPPELSLPLSMAADSSRYLINLSAQLEATIDNGSTEDLLRLINAPGVGSGVLQFVLSEANPYMTDTVLLALIARYPDVNPIFFRYVLETNSPLTEPVLQAALAVLPSGTHADLLELQTLDPSPRERLKAWVMNIRSRQAAWQNKLDQHAWEMQAWDSLLLWSELDTDRHFSLLIEQERWADLQNYINSGAGLNTPRLSIANSWLSLGLSGRSIDEISPAERSALQAMTFQEGRLGIAARNMLRAVDGRAWNEPLPSSPFLRHVDLAQDAIEELSVLEQASLIYPNPFREVIYIRSADAAGGSYQLSDLRGVVMQSGDLGSNGLIQTKDLSAGVYLLTLNMSNGEQHYERVISLP